MTVVVKKNTRNTLEVNMPRQVMGKKRIFWLGTTSDFPETKKLLFIFYYICSLTTFKHEISMLKTLQINY